MASNKRDIQNNLMVKQIKTIKNKLKITMLANKHNKPWKDQPHVDTRLHQDEG